MRRILSALISLLATCSYSGPSVHAPAPPPTPSAAAPLHAGASQRIDALLEAEWKAAGISPGTPATDAQFLRRAWLDVAGTLPPPEAVTAFLADPSRDKRARAIDALLANPRYALRWSEYWEDVMLGPAASKANMIDRAAFRAFLRARLADNTPWDQIVRDLVTATGQNSAGGSVRERRIAAETFAGEPEAEGVNGAVNWILSYGRSPENVAGATSRLFLGVQIQCAQCHDHKSEPYTMNDFRRFAATFTRTRGEPDSAREKSQMRVFRIHDARKPRLGRKATDEQREIAALSPAALDGTALSGDAPRAALASWMTSKANPWFDKAIVNRMWAHFMGHGFVEPIDDQRPSNPPRAGAVLEALSADFAANGRDLAWLVRAICHTRAYSLGAGTKEAEEIWAAFRPRAVPAPVLFDAIVAATGIEPVVSDVMGERADALRARARHRFRFVFDVDEGASRDDFEGTVAQALLLLNGPLVGLGSSALQGMALARVLAMPGGDAAKLRALFLRTLSREPSAEEITRLMKFLDEAERAPHAAAAGPWRGQLARLGHKVPSVAHSARDRAYEDIFWALLGSSEFALQH